MGWYRYDDELRGRRFPLVDVERGIVLVAHVDDRRRDIGEIRWRWFTTHQRHCVQRQQNRTGEKLVFVGSTRMSENSRDGL